MQKHLFCLRQRVCRCVVIWGATPFPALTCAYPCVAYSGAPAGLKAVGLPVSTRDAVTLLHKSLSNAAGHNVHFRCGCGEGCMSNLCLRSAWWWACAAASEPVQGSRAHRALQVQLWGGRE